MENPEIKRKLAKLHELHELENEIMKQITLCGKKIKHHHGQIIANTKEKEKLCKRISHNMKLRHIIINELEILKKEK